MLVTRVVYGVLMASAVVSLLAADEMLSAHGITDVSPGMLMLAITGGLVGGAEFYALARRAGADPFDRLGVGLILACMGAAWWLGWYTGPLGQPIPPMAGVGLALAGAVAIAVVFFAQGLRGESRGATFNIAVTLLGVLYLGVLAGFFILFRFAAGSAWNVVLLLTVIKCTDVGAYLTGRALGRHKLIAWLSPGKTWEGTIGGLMLAAALAVTFGLTCGHLGWPGVGPSLLLGMVCAAIGQLGDLAKSLLKRDASVKDSSDAVPGFGGVLDIIDSPLMAGPFAWAIWTCLCQNRGL